MIHHQHKMIFVHVQKTAGKSVRKVLGLRGGSLHLPASELRPIYGEAVWNSYFKFGFVRNPWDRLVSAYFYCKSGGNHSDYDRKRAAMLPDSFEDFVAQLDDYVTLENEHIFKPQVFWLCEQNGGLMVDHVGRFEQLRKEIKLLAKRVGKRWYRLPKSNASRHQHYTAYYTPPMINKVGGIYQQDVKLFDYQFSG